MFDLFGVGVIVLIIDNMVMFLKRSKYCVEVLELWDVFGGYLEF